MLNKYNFLAIDLWLDTIHFSFILRQEKKLKVKYSVFILQKKKRKKRKSGYIWHQNDGYMWHVHTSFCYWNLQLKEQIIFHIHNFTSLSMAAQTTKLKSTRSSNTSVLWQPPKPEKQYYCISPYYFSQYHFISQRSTVSRTIRHGKVRKSAAPHDYFTAKPHNKAFQWLQVCLRWNTGIFWCREDLMRADVWKGQTVAA